MNNFAFRRKLQAAKKPAITAIEPQYSGYRFRSRLEARWAVFFDALGLQWEYEKQGYKLGGAGWYLPDFWLPSLDTWVEIKPEASQGASDKICALSSGLEQNGLLLAGAPGYSLHGDYGHCSYTMIVYAPHVERWRPVQWAIGADDGVVTIVPQPDSPGRFLIATAPAQLLAAYNAARGARFEHGERGERGL